MDKEIVWEANSLVELKKFPTNIKVNIGGNLKRLQLNKKPLDCKSMNSIARGLYELRNQDSTGCYRVVYYIKLSDRIYVLHSFKKKTSKTSSRDVAKVKTRLKNLLSRRKQEGSL